MNDIAAPEQAKQAADTPHGGEVLPDEGQRDRVKAGHGCKTPRSVDLSNGNLLEAELSTGGPARGRLRVWSVGVGHSTAVSGEPDHFFRNVLFRLPQKDRHDPNDQRLSTTPSQRGGQGPGPGLTPPAHSARTPAQLQPSPHSTTIRLITMASLWSPSRCLTFPENQIPFHMARWQKLCPVLPYLPHFPRRFSRVHVSSTLKLTEHMLNRASQD